MDADILPCLGSRPITTIEARELVAMVKAIEERGARDIAKRALETTGQVFRFAVAHGYATRNPASEIRPGDLLKSTRKVNYARAGAPTIAQRFFERHHLMQQWADYLDTLKADSAGSAAA